MTDPEPDRGPTTGTPRWLSVVGVCLVVVVITVLVILHLTGTIGSGTH